MKERFHKSSSFTCDPARPSSSRDLPGQSEVLPQDLYEATTWYCNGAYRFYVNRKKEHGRLLCEWNELDSYTDIGDLRVGNFVHICHADEEDRLGLVVALKQDQRPQSSACSTYVLFVWMLSQKALDAQNANYQLAAGKTHILSNWCQVLPFNYLKALPDCHADSDTSKFQTGFLFDVSRKRPKGNYEVQEFRIRDDCEVSNAIAYGDPSMKTNNPRRSNRRIRGAGKLVINPGAKRQKQCTPGKAGHSHQG